MLIEGSFRELVEEFSEYIVNIKASQETSSSLRADITPSLEALTKAEEANDVDAAEKARDEVLKVLVPKTDALNSAPEKGSLKGRISAGLETNAYRLIRIHRCVQSSHSPCRPVFEYQQLPTNNLP